MLVLFTTPSPLFPDRCFTWRFPHSLCTDSFHFLRNLINKGTRDDRPVTAFYHETENRSENGEEVVLQRKGGLKRGEEEQSKREKDGRPVSELEKTNTKSAKEGENKVEGEDSLMEVDMNKSDGQTNPEECLTAASDDGPSCSEQTDDKLPKKKCAASNTTPPGSEEPSEVLDMVQVFLDSPGGACVVSLSLMSLGLLSVHISIPRQMVVVDSNLVDKDVVKRSNIIWIRLLILYSQTSVQSLF